jgi:mRNA interferase RelE/StbE
MYHVQYSKNARRDINSIELNTARRISKKIMFFASQEDPLKFAKPIKDNEMGDYRFRIGDYRVLFDLDQKGNIRILTILRIKHRKDIYRT